MEYFLGLDNGGTVTKAALFDSKGREIAVHAEKTAMLYPAPGCTERNLDDLWSANVQAVRGVLSRSGVAGNSVKALAVTGYGNGAILIGTDGRPVWDGIISTDYRARSIVDRWYADGTFEAVFAHTVQSLWPAQPVSLLAWFKQNRPDVIERTAHVLMCKDYIRYRLTGEISGEISDNSGISAVDLATGTYSAEVFSAMGISDCMRMFPPMAHSTDICGRVTAEAAEATGLTAGTPVAGGLFDIHAAGLASGVTEPGILSCVAGTWTINQVLLDQPLRQKDIFNNSISPAAGRFLAMEGSPTSTSNLDWLIREVLLERKEKVEKEGLSIFEYCDHMAESIDPAESDVMFLPFLYGSNVGGSVKAAFLGLECRHERAHLIRAVYEGIIFATKMHVDRLLRSLDTPRVVRLAGGPARSSTWVHLYADTLGLPVEVVNVSEMGALGAAMCAAVAAGYHADISTAAEHMVNTGRAVDPDPGRIPVLAEKYRSYADTLAKLKTL
jgi:L-xylulokinase